MLNLRLVNTSLVIKLMPVLVLAGAILLWEAWVRINHIPHYLLPAPSLVAETLFKDWHSLWPSLVFTLKLTFAALGVAILGGVLLAVVFTFSRWIERAFLPFAVILQVTPIIAIAPLILIYVDSTFGFFPNPLEHRHRLA
jgi:NitT/TauT family transport system permease protein